MKKESRLKKILDNLDNVKTAKKIDPDTSNFMLLTDDEIALVLSQRVKRLRIENGKRQSDIADKAGMPVSSYAVFEREGKVSLPSFIAITRALGRAGELEDLLTHTIPERIKEIEQQKKDKKIERVRIKKGK